VAPNAFSKTNGPRRSRSSNRGQAVGGFNKVQVFERQSPLSSTTLAWELKFIGSNYRIRHPRSRIRLIGAHANDPFLMGFYAPFNREGEEGHHQRVGFPVGLVGSLEGVPAHHDFCGAGNWRAVYLAEVANHARVSADALYFVGILDAQKLDASVVDGEPDFQLYQLARFFVGTEPLAVGFDGGFQFRCHARSPCPVGENRFSAPDPIWNPAISFPDGARLFACRCPS